MLGYHQFVERVALPLSDRLTHSGFWALSSEMTKLRNSSESKLKEVQRQRLQKIFDVAQTQTEFWKSRLVGSDHVECPFERLAKTTPVSKSELESGFPSEVVNQSFDRAELRFSSTGGTTQRMTCVHDFAKREAMRASMVNTLRDSGYRIGMPMVEIPPSICDTVCGELGETNDGVLAHIAKMVRKKRLKDMNAFRDLRGKVESNWVYRRKTYPSFTQQGSTQPIDNLDRYIELLKRDEPALLKANTIYLFQIAKHLLDRKQSGNVDWKINVPIIKPLGSGATPNMISTIEAAFGGRFIGDYGSAELGPIASECLEGGGMHVFSDLFIVEILNRDGERMKDGELGEVVITDLTNRAMPLIRYRIGDLGRIDSTRCSCGNLTERIFVEGRVHDALPLKAGGWLTSFAIAEKFFSFPNVDHFQVIEKRNGSLVISVVPKPDEKIDPAMLESMFANLLGEPRKIKIRKVRSILPEEGGKFRWVKSNSMAREARNVG